MSEAEFLTCPTPDERPDLWPWSAAREGGVLRVGGVDLTSVADEFGTPTFVLDVEAMRGRARVWASAMAEEFWDGYGMSGGDAFYAGKAFLSADVARLVAAEGLGIDTASLGELSLALRAGVDPSRIGLHGNNKSDAEIELAIEQGFAKIVVDEPDEPARIAAIARRLGKRARVMLRVTAGIHAGGHEYISTAHEDQKFGVPLLPAGADAAALSVLDELTADPAGVTPAATNAHIAERDGDAGDGNAKPERELHYDVKYPYDLSHEEIPEKDKALAAAMATVADGPALAVLKDILTRSDELELVGIHSHIGSNIHDADAFIQAAKRMMLLRKTFYATDAYTLPEVDLGGGYSVAYTDGEDSMDVRVELRRLAEAVGAINRALGVPAPAISFEPGRWIVAPAGVTLYRVGTIKPVHLSDAKDKTGNPIDERVYVSVDGGMSDNIRPALYGADYTVRLANRRGSDESMLVRVVGMHCESGDIIVHEDRLPADLRRGDILAVPVTGAYGRTMASNYNQALIPAVVAVSEAGAHVMIRRQTIDDLLDLDQG